MNFSVFRLARQQFKVLWAVVLFIAVFMMNNLTSFKISPQLPFHNKTMFSDISSMDTIWMIWTILGYVAVFFTLAAFPPRIVTSSYSLENCC